MESSRLAPELWLADQLGVNYYRLNFNQKDFKIAVKGSFFSEIERLLSNAGQSNPPINPIRLFKLRKIENLRFEDMNAQGRLITTKSGFEIILKKGLSEERKRFLTAHEICHTFFYNLSRIPPISGFEVTKENFEVVEGFCSEGARRILMPERAFQIWIKNTRFPDSKTILDGTRMFRVSPELLIRRLQESKLWNWSVLFVFVSYSEAAGATEFRVQRRFKTNLGSKVSLPKVGSVVMEPETTRFFEEVMGNRASVISRPNERLRIGMYSHTNFPVSTLRISSWETYFLVVLPRHKAVRDENKFTQLSFLENNTKDQDK